MRQSKQLFVAVVALFIVLGLSGCDKQEQPDFSGYKKIADLATIDCTFHNVAEIYNDGTDIIFGINGGCGRFFVPSYAAQPSLRRYSSGLSHPSERLILPEQ